MNLFRTCFPFRFFFAPLEADILATIIQLEKTIHQLERYGEIVRALVDDQRHVILAINTPKWKKDALLRRRKMLLGRAGDILAQRERLYTLLVAIQQSVHINLTVQALQLANQELKRLHIENIESTINQMDDLISIEEERTQILASSQPSDDDLQQFDLELDLLRLDAIEKSVNISLPLCPKTDLRKSEKTAQETLV